ncbi:hypothetical protein NA57DRAFT_59267 [Rhizodiscina lignyota]|uniref:Fungal N-terminal domain-containing protein n=1 Tax=Rhizodiscina lignyota TaxID=1504668 RepID=A0A9P4IBH8_9PEZI|nr:hypothetical protein NA57DRAFT_59267 [Rhizodiscina lignyota]
MADPFSIAALSIKVTASTAQLIVDLNALRGRYKAVPRNVQLFTTQVSALRSATSSLAVWLKKTEVDDDKRKKSEDAAHQQLKRDLHDLLEGCDLLIAVIAEHIKNVRKDTEGVGFAVKTRYVWGEKELEDHRKALGYQCDALMFILKCLELSDKTATPPAINSTETRQLIALAKDSASSILSRDDSSQRSNEGQGPIEFGSSSTLERPSAYIFEELLQQSQPYVEASRSPTDTRSSLSPRSSTETETPSSSITGASSNDTTLQTPKMADAKKIAQLEEKVKHQDFVISRLKREKEGIKILSQYITDCSTLQLQLEEREMNLQAATERIQGQREELGKMETSLQLAVVEVRNQQEKHERTVTDMNSRLSSLQQKAHTAWDELGQSNISKQSLEKRLLEDSEAHGDSEPCQLTDSFNRASLLEERDTTTILSETKTVLEAERDRLEQHLKLMAFDVVELQEKLEKESADFVSCAANFVACGKDVEVLHEELKHQKVALSAIQNQYEQRELELQQGSVKLADEFQRFMAICTRVQSNSTEGTNKPVEPTEPTFNKLGNGSTAQTAEKDVPRVSWGQTLPPQTIGQSKNEAESKRPRTFNDIPPFRETLRIARGGSSTKSPSQRKKRFPVNTTHNA